jgi:hypothetical protein
MQDTETAKSAATPRFSRAGNGGFHWPDHLYLA